MVKILLGLFFSRMNDKTFDDSCCSCIYPLQSGRENSSIPPPEQREVYGVAYSDSQVIISLLLILAGDIEVNPGPGENSELINFSH